MSDHATQATDAEIGQLTATVRVLGIDRRIRGRSTAELFSLADSMGATRLVDSLNGVCLKLRGDWVWVK